MTTHAWYEQFEIDSDNLHEPIVDGSTVPVGTTVAYNVWAYVDAVDWSKVEVVVEIVNSPGKARWNSRTPNDGPLSIKGSGAVAETNFWAGRTYQTLDRPGDYYFIVHCFSHQGGVVGPSTEIEVHAV